VNESGELIADALREIADQAVAPRPMADAAWRAGHRRRHLSVIATSAAVAAAAITIAVAGSLGTTGGLGRPGAHRQGGGSTAAGSGSPAPVRLHTPIQFEQVAWTSDKRCAAGAGQMPGPAPASCVHLTGTGMTITGVDSARVQRVAGGYQLDVRLSPADSRVFAALTRELAGLRSPHNQFAVIADGRVLTLPMVESPITAGRAAISGFTSRAQAERIIWGTAR
jgi:preprotein translocase subunit SecD